MRILVVEDDPRITRFLQQGLEESGYTVTVVENGEDGYLEARVSPFDLVVLDLMLPGMNGIEIAKQLRARRNTAPILMLTARDAEQDKVEGLDAGADDYLTKPFGFAEFLARVRALLRRESMNRSSVMTVDDLEVDVTSRRVRRAGQEIELSAREYALLEFLMYSAGRTVTREQIVEHVWAEEGVWSNVVDVYVGYLRRKIDDPFQRPLIHTVRGVGYSLRETS